MRTTAVRRVGLAASAATLALLATACGGSSDEGAEAAGTKSETTASASAAAAEPAAAKALSAADLEKAALAQGDVEGGEVETEVTGADDVTTDQVKTDNAACAPLAFVQAGAAQGEPVATVKRIYEGEAEKPSGADASSEDAMLAGLDAEKAVVTLASYEDGGAETVFKDTKAALEKCAGGFTATALGQELPVTKVAGTEAPKGADEAVAMTLTVTVEGGTTMPFKAVVVRKGATVASVSAANLASAATGEDFEFPTAVLDAQLKKLG
ncbi:lipoprotein [Streptomyces ruber]|uniref:Lipoprotein n=2 Tax=Streptomyces TaxID=1883 RepID=A0A918B7P9_9ACTN|nr:hypothetical protein [Streptomyces ruber]GGQ39446.1 lipoprotein [Streptomyces ruber]